MVRSLCEWGYRRVGFLSLNYPGNSRTVERRTGYRKAVAEFGLPSESGLEAQVSFGFQAGRSGLRTILGAQPKADAIFCSSDTLAVGALTEAIRMGLRVPDDLAIAGFGDVELAAELVPSLTTVRLPRAEIGTRTAELLLARIAGTYDGPSVIDCGYEIVRRESA